MVSTLKDTLYENNQSRIDADFSIFSAIHLCASNTKCDAYNEEAALQTIDRKFSVNSLDSLGKQQRNDPYYRQVGGVRVSVQVYGTMRMMLTNNLNTKLGLVNGAMGTIRKVCVSQKANGGMKFEYILVEFDKKLDINVCYKARLIALRFSISIVQEEDNQINYSIYITLEVTFTKLLCCN